MSASRNKTAAYPDRLTSGKLVFAWVGKAGSQKILNNYLGWLLLIWPAIALYRYTPYYSNSLSPGTQAAILYSAVVYTLAAPAAYYLRLSLTGNLPVSRGYLAVATLGRLAKGYSRYLRQMVTRAFYPAPALSKEERTNLLFMLVKLFFIPIMLNFLFGNFDGMHQSANALNGGLKLSLVSFNTIIYPLVLGLLLVIDTAYFSFGYLVESRLLNNRVVSVDPTFLGWFTCIICYPPVSSLTGNYLPWYANDYSGFHGQSLTALIHFGGLLFMFIYVCASVALGPKASNLTNRGIVSRWPYSLVRHPAYISKNTAWWLTILPIISPGVILAMAGWTTIYFLRAITEERHLMMADNGYKQYAAKVRWRFVPGVY